MTPEEHDRRIAQFEGHISASYAGLHRMPSGKEEPSIAVSLEGSIGPVGLGRALGSIITAYLKGRHAPREDMPEAKVIEMHAAVLLAIHAGIAESIRTAEMVAIQHGGVN